MTVGSRENGSSIRARAPQFGAVIGTIILLAGAASAQQGDTAVSHKLVARNAAARANVPPSPTVANAAMGGDTATVRRLVAHGADVNAAQGDGMTALHWAAQRGDLALTDALIRAHANVNAATLIDAYTPLNSGPNGIMTDTRFGSG